MRYVCLAVFLILGLVGCAKDKDEAQGLLISDIPAGCTDMNQQGAHEFVDLSTTLLVEWHYCGVREGKVCSYYVEVAAPNRTDTRCE